MQSYTVRFHVDAPPGKVWRVPHPPVPPNAPRPRVLEWPTGSMEILNEGDEAGSTVLTFHETYHAFNPVLRFLLERPVHAKISRDNLKVYEHALRYAGPVQRLPARLLGGS